MAVRMATESGEEIHAVIEREREKEKRGWGEKEKISTSIRGFNGGSESDVSRIEPGSNLPSRLQVERGQ